VKYLKGFREYLDDNYVYSIFDTALNQQDYWTFHLHEHQLLSAKVTQNLIYDVELSDRNQLVRTIPKTEIKLLYPSDLSSTIKKNIKSDKNVKKLNLQPIISARPRYHIKNKTLYVLMKERQVIYFTLLEGEILRGLIAAFTRYDITVHLKGGIPVTLMRHSIYDLKDKRNRCYLKIHQETCRDWKKSSFYVAMDT
jgi:hypothetical protein